MLCTAAVIREREGVWARGRRGGRKRRRGLKWLEEKESEGIQAFAKN